MSHSSVIINSNRVQELVVPLSKDIRSSYGSLDYEHFRKAFGELVVPVTDGNDLWSQFMHTLVEDGMLASLRFDEPDVPVCDFWEVFCLLCGAIETAANKANGVITI